MESGKSAQGRFLSLRLGQKVGLRDRGRKWRKEMSGESFVTEVEENIIFIRASCEGSKKYCKETEASSSTLGLLLG